MIMSGEDFLAKYKEVMPILKALRAVDSIFSQDLTVENWKKAFQAMKVKPTNTIWKDYFQFAPVIKSEDITQLEEN